MSRTQERLDVENSGVGKLYRTPSTLQISNSMPLELPSFPVFESLTQLFLFDCHLTSILESVCLCVSLKSLHLEQCDCESLPTSIKYLSNLEELWVTNCKSLQELPELPPNIVILRAVGCDSLKTICSLTVYRDAERIVFSGCPKLVGNEEINVLLGYKFLSDHIKKENNWPKTYHGPDSKIPEWFRYQNVGASVTFHLPILDSSTFNLLGFAFSAVVANKHEYCRIDARIQTRGRKLWSAEYTFAPSDVKDMIILYYPIKFELTTDELIQMSGTVSQVYFDVYPKSGPAKVTECGVHPFYKEEVGSSGKINQPLRLME